MHLGGQPADQDEVDAMTPSAAKIGAGSNGGGLVTLAS